MHDRHRTWQEDFMIQGGKEVWPEVRQMRREKKRSVKPQSLYRPTRCSAVSCVVERRQQKCQFQKNPCFQCWRRRQVMRSLSQTVSPNLAPILDHSPRSARYSRSAARSPNSQAGRRTRMSDSNRLSYPVTCIELSWTEAVAGAFLENIGAIG